MNLRRRLSRLQIEMTFLRTKLTDLQSRPAPEKSSATPPTTGRIIGEEGLRVVHVVLSLDPGGLERVVIDLVREGRSFGQLASVVCIERLGLLFSELEQARVPAFCVEKRPGLRPCVIGRLKMLFNILQPDVVHTHQVGALLYAGPAARRAGVPVIVHTEHGKHYASRRRARWLGRLAGLYAQRFFGVSRDIANELRTCRITAKEKIAVAPNGIDIARFRDCTAGADTRREFGVPPSAPLVGAVGRLAEIKRHDLLIRAFACVRRRLPEARLLLVGDGPERTPLEQLAAQLLPADCVRFAGRQAAPERFLKAMDVMALTSRSEGMPLAVLEAWAAGTPVVATRVGGISELVADGATGLLVESGNVDHLAGAIERLLADRPLAARISAAAARQAYERYSLEQMAANYQRHYDELLSSFNRDGGPQRFVNRLQQV